MFKNRLVKKNNTETHANCKLHSYPIWLIIWFEMTLDRVSIVGNFTFTCESHEIHLWKLGKDKKIDLSSNLKRKCMASRIHRQKEETMCWRVEGLAILRNPKLCVLVKREKTLVADVSLRIPKEYLDNLVKVKPLKNLKLLSYEFFKCIWSTMFVNFGINAVLSFYAW